MKLMEIYRRIFESTGIDMKMYNGNPGLFAFSKFDTRAIGSGVVTRGMNHRGFYFTSTIDNAKFYAEFLVCRVGIRNVVELPDDVDERDRTHPPTLMKRAVSDGSNYIIRDILDGWTYSDIVLVPMSNVDDISILEWIFVGDKEVYHTALTEFFFRNDLDYASKDEVADVLGMIELRLEDQLKIPEFKEWYDSL